MHREQIDAGLAAHLVAEQFPQWADLPVSPVAFSGWDNRTFRFSSRGTASTTSARSCHHQGRRLCAQLTNA
jgi:aminoglycoside phosphotransferase (APT) family kinase protein